MTPRKRNSPGIEINEIDHSQYNNKPDFSIVGTTTFICGFADKGENYTTQWINSTKTLINTYGYPTNEPEKYFYNSAIEILNKGGMLLMSKLPYNNKSKDHFPTTEYKINSNWNDISCNSETSADANFYVSQLSGIDNTLTSYVHITNNNVQNNALISIDDLDEYKTNYKVIQPDTFKIVDITQKQYDSIDLLSCQSIEVEKDVKIKYFNVNAEFLGILPVIVSPVNAMFYQQLISNETYVEVDTDINLSGEELTRNLSAYQPICDALNRNNNIEKLSHFSNRYVIGDNFQTIISSNNINDSTVSKIATNYFPLINYINTNFINRKYLKQIGVVIFEVFKDEANNKKINFSPVESFIGSLDRNEKDANNSSIFIDNIINSQSKYINFFSNVRISDNYKNASTILIKNQIGKILGFKKLECIKNIDYLKSIVEPLNIIFDRNKDPNLVNIDIVCDAGVSNIAQYAKTFGSYNDDPEDPKYPQPKPLIYERYNADCYPFDWKKNDNGTDRNIQWKVESILDSTAWKAILVKYDNFCKFERKDCLCLADGLRPFCLTGNEKIVRSSNLKSSIENDIIPKLKYMSGINSSYSAGYCNWFYVKDYYSSDYLWLPPSIKASGVCTYIDTYFHSWDAPAGTSRGALNNVFDTAFSPRNDEAGKIYQQTWNYAINYPIDGIVIEGQKTFQIEKTALDRINVRRLMLYLEKQVRYIARRFLYEGNTAYMRQKFVDTIKPIFENTKNGYGISDYAIKCDDTNNPTSVIDNNEMRCSIAVKPVKTIEWIICDFIVTNQSANVLEEVVRN